jgi:hypothetical protein
MFQSITNVLCSLLTVTPESLLLTRQFTAEFWENLYTVMVFITDLWDKIQLHPAYTVRNIYFNRAINMHIFISFYYNDCNVRQRHVYKMTRSTHLHTYMPEYFIQMRLRYGRNKQMLACSGF